MKKKQYVRSHIYIYSFVQQISVKEVKHHLHLHHVVCRRVGVVDGGGCGSADGAGVAASAQPRGDAGPVEGVGAPRQDEATLAVLVLRQAYHAPVTAGRQPLVIISNVVAVRDVGDALHQPVDGEGEAPASEAAHRLDS
jgi:hypothetical protein